MRTKLELLPQNINDWRHKEWYMYASQMYNDKTLRFWMNLEGMYKVTHGYDVKYEGTQLTHALAAWDAA